MAAFVETPNMDFSRERNWLLNDPIFLAAIGSGGGLSVEQIQDMIANFIQVSGSLTKSYDDVNNVLNLSVAGSQTPINVASASNGATATATSSLNGTTTPDKAIDGDNATIWHSMSGFPQTLTVDFNALRTIQSLQIIFGNTATTRSYTIEYYNGSLWQNVETVSNDASMTHSKTGLNLSASKIRFTATADTYNYFIVTDVNVQGY